MATEIANQQVLPIFPRPFLFMLLAAATPTANDDPTIWETKAETGGDGNVDKDYADDEDDGGGKDTSVIADSDGKEDDDA